MAGGVGVVGTLGVDVDDDAGVSFGPLNETELDDI